MMRGKESGRSGSPASSEPTFRNRFTYHLMPNPILVHAVLDLVYSRLRYCVVYSSAVRCMRYIYWFHFNVPHLFLAAKFHPMSGSRWQGRFVVSIPRCRDFPYISCKNKMKVIYAYSAVRLLVE
jgi:hypothetical protein